MAAISTRFVEALRRDALGRTFLNAEGTGITAGSTVRNPALAETLRAFGREGADYFYQGPVADEIVRAAAAIGGVITADDLRGYRVAERTPLSAERFGHRWVTAPPESAGGYTLLASLALLERWAPQGEADVVHALGESFRGPFLDRARYFGDPDFVRVPVDALLAPDRIAARAARFDRAHARPSADYDLPLPDAPAPVAVPPGAGTSHLCVVDAEGNVLSMTTTVNLLFGAQLTAGGIVLNDEMDDFSSPPAADATGPAGEHHKPRGRAATSGVDHDPEHRAAGRPPRALRGRERRYAHRDRGDPGRLPRGGAARARGRCRGPPPGAPGRAAGEHERGGGRARRAVQAELRARGTRDRAPALRRGGAGRADRLGERRGAP